MHRHNKHKPCEWGRWEYIGNRERERGKKRWCIYDVYSLQFKRLKRPTVKLHLSNGGALICLIVSNIVHTIKAKNWREFAILISSLNKSGQPKEQPALSSGISFGWVENNDTQSLPWIPCSHPKRREWRILIHKLRGQNELALRLGWYEVNESPSFFFLSFQGRESESW